MPLAGLEPAWSSDRQILSLLCIPFHHRGIAQKLTDSSSSWLPIGALWRAAVSLSPLRAVRLIHRGGGVWLKPGGGWPIVWVMRPTHLVTKKGSKDAVCGAHGGLWTAKPPYVTCKPCLDAMARMRPLPEGASWKRMPDGSLRPYPVDGWAAEWEALKGAVKGKARK